MRRFYIRAAQEKSEKQSNWAGNAEQEQPITIACK